MYRVSRGRRENLAQNDYVVRREYEPKRDIITSSFFFPSPFEKFFPLSNFRFLPVGNIILLVFSPRFPSPLSFFYREFNAIYYYQLLSTVILSVLVLLLFARRENWHRCQLNDRLGILSWPSVSEMDPSSSREHFNEESSMRLILVVAGPRERDDFPFKEREESRSSNRGVS